MLPLQMCTTVPSVCGAGDPTQGFTEPRQELYQLTYILSPMSIIYEVN